MRFAVLALGLVLGCSAPAKTPDNRVDPLALDATALANLDDRCAHKIATSPFAYFRYTNRPFVDLVCGRYATSITSMPIVHAHGDAHVEQYAVAAEGRGLADYDASALGPPVVDLVRFATSLVLASPGDPRGARTAIDAFVGGYQHGLLDPAFQGEEPAPAARLRSRFAPTRAAWLDRVEKLIVPIPALRREIAAEAWAEFVTQIRETNPTLSPAFFGVKVGGRLDMGIGSYHAAKFLVRIEGPTPAPDDDLMVEAKALEMGALGSCMHGADLDAARIVKGQSQLSNAPQRFLGAVTINGRPFYSHTWLVHYTELSTADIGSASELAELAADVGLQLGRGHAKLPDRGQVPGHVRALQRTIATLDPTLVDTAFDLAAHVTRTWTAYVTLSHRLPSGPSGNGAPPPVPRREALSRSVRVAD